MAVTFLPSVVLDPRTAAHDHMLAALEDASALIKVDLVVTCGREGHPPTDPHTRGQALDIRSRDLGEGQIWSVYDHLKRTLGPKWTVLYECKSKPKGFLGSFAYVNPKASAAHFHVQPLKGTIWTP